MTIHFDPRAAELNRQRAIRDAFMSAKVRTVFGRRGKRRAPIVTPEFALVLVGVVGLILIVGLGV